MPLKQTDPDQSAPHPEERAACPSGRRFAPPQDEAARVSKERRGSNTPQIRYDPRRHAEVFRAIADVTGVHVHCEHRACLRARRCTAQEPPCFVTHIADFHRFLREKLGPRFQKEIAKQDYAAREER